MAGSVNKVILIGNLGAAPEIKYLPSGQPACEMRVATSHSFKDKTEQVQERTEWHRVVVYGKTAENCAKYLQKGRQVYIEGRIHTRSWDDKDGNKRYMTEIVGNEVVFLRSGSAGEDTAMSSSMPGDTRGRAGHAGSAYSEEPFPSGSPGDDEIPF